MSVNDIIGKLRAKRIELSVVEGKLRVQGNKEALGDAELLGLVRQNRQALIEAVERGEYRNSPAGLVAVPPNLIPQACAHITPAMLTLVTLNEEEIARVVASVPGGAANVQDIYPLGPLQQGILFHYLMQGVGDVYLLPNLSRFDSRERLDHYIKALQAAIDRHDILRTSFLWQDLPEPVQVVWRHAPLVVEEIVLDPAAGDIAAQLQARFHPQRYRLDVRQAPLWRLFVAQDPIDGHWVVLDLMQHLLCDHTTGALLVQEIQAHLLGRADQLPAPLPFRNFIAQARLGVSREEHEAFFTRMLGDVDAPTLPFGLADAQGDGSTLVEAHQEVDAALGRRLRACARALGVSAASVCHLAWAMVLARVSGRDDVVFGSLLFGRMRAGAGAERALGMFINTLPVRIVIGDDAARPSLRKTHELLSELIRHEHAPLALAQRCSGVPAPAPLFTAHLNYRHEGHAASNAEAAALAAQAWAGIEVLREEERTNYPLGLAVNDLDSGFSLDVQVDQAIDPQRVFALVQTALASLVTALEQDAPTPIRQLEVLSAPESDALLALGDGGPGIQTLGEGVRGGLYGLVAAQAGRSPDAVALAGAGAEISYRELVQRANGVAQQLRTLGIGAENRIAILTDRSIESIVGVLGILAAGAAYVPLDPSHPDERLAQLLADATVSALLAPEALRARAHRVATQQPALAGKVLVIADAPQADELPQLADVRADHAAYVIYTSGSTGTPKGVVIEQGSAMNLVEAFVARHDFAGQRLLMIPPLVFDASVGDVFPVLAVGATLVLHPAPAELGPVELQQFCAEHRVTAIDAPAALWRRWTEGFANVRDQGPILPGVTLLMFGGESVAIEQVRRFAALTEHRIALSNHYGPTEATVCATMLATRGGEELGGAELPIGKPLPGVQVYVLDEHLKLLPRGVEGELFIAGAGVARGYLGESGPSFLSDPFSRRPGARMYATGDLVRWNPDGTLQFLGRRDQQVKIRGFRIEPGEIEARLVEHAGVREAVVLAREDSPGDKRLVAYVVPAQALDTPALRKHLSAVLPEHLVPAAVVQMESLPLTPNGKLDRKALPAPDAAAYASREYEAPVGEVESTLARIWADVLKQGRVGRRDNFFELGGHSLLAATQMSRLRQALKIDVPLKDLFAHPVLADFAEVVKGAACSEPSAITPAPRDAALPLSFAQQRLWFLAQMEGVSEAYHMPMGLRLRGDLDRAALKQALDRIVRRHEALRTTFRRIDGKPVQHVGGADCGFELQEHELRAHSAEELELRMSSEASLPFDLAHGPLIRGQLLRLAEQEHVLLITMHHIASDAWSIGVLIGELNTLYRAYREGRDDPLPPLAIQYADYAIWQRRWLTGAVLQAQSGYWRCALEGAPALLSLPTDRPRPAQQGLKGAQLPLELDATLARQLKALAQRHGMTLYMTLLAAWATVLARLAKQAEVVIGSPVANRTRGETEALIGFFINTLALRVPVAGNVDELLRRVKATALDAQQHQELPFEQVVELVKPPRSLAHTPVFQVMFTWQNADEGVLDLPGLAVSPAAAPYEVAKFDLELELREEGERIVGGLGYATALFDRGTIARHAGYLRQVLAAMVADERQAVDRIELLSPAQRRQQLVEWNATPVQYAQEACIHGLFEAQAQCRPEAIALVHEGRTLCYAELNRRANRLAHHLRKLGVGPDKPVAISVARSLEMVVGLLAILKAGGAYLPLDPLYPAERLAYMLQDSAPAALLVDSMSAKAAALATGAMPVLDLLFDTAAWDHEAETDPGREGLTSKHLAYIIYTSGSTGAPKGVMVEHANVARLLSATEDWFHFGPHDVWTLFHSFAFDFSVWEIWGALAYGGRLVVVPHQTTRSPQEFYRLLCRERVTVLNQTPSAFRQLVAAQADAVGEHSLRTVIFGGEALEVATLKPWVERERNRATRLVNMYGITETTVHVTYRELEPADTARLGASPIGVRIPDLRIYILDPHRQPVPIGVAGELYVGGAGVARGYLNRPELNAERFLADPFSAEPAARLYKTGDLGRHLADGSIEYLGRNDHQVKIRGFRIELGEIEARLAEHPGVREAAVLAREDRPGDKRLVAYLTTAQPLDIEALRKHLGTVLPEHMVPAAYVQLERLPLTSNGKLDRKALPAPDGAAYMSREYEAPVGEVESTLARIWAEVLKLERVGRHDNFFELGGHSLLAITLIERMRLAGLRIDVRSLFASPTLKEMAESARATDRVVEVPPNLIPMGCTALTPAMLPLVELTEGEIASVVATVAGGAANVQDIYPLAPLQAGMLFHHQMQSRGDVYLTTKLFGFDSRERIERYAEALQAAISRHDILRTAFAWEGLAEPVQVVWRHAALVTLEVDLDPVTGDIATQLRSRFDPRQHRLDLRQAPLWRLFVAEDKPNRRWLALELVHHLIDDNTSQRFLTDELEAHLLGDATPLPAPPPFRNFIAHALRGVRPEEHEAFFHQMLADVDEPTAPFGLTDVQGDGSRIVEAQRLVDPLLGRRLRAAARACGVSAASVCHLAWAMVLAQAAGRDDVVFGTVMFGRMQGAVGGDRALGMFINMLPLRIRLGDDTARTSLRKTHALLSQLMRHEHAPLSLALRCSGVRGAAPLFSSMLNYRHSAAELPSAEAAERSARAWTGIELLDGQERTNYPFSMFVDDLADGFSLTAQVDAAVDPQRVCALMHTAMESLVAALEQSHATPVGRLSVLPAAERTRVLLDFNATAVDYPRESCLHQLFETQAARTPNATALRHADRTLSYAELNRQANRLAHHLRTLGVVPDARVAICAERSPEMVVGLLAILKAGGAYVPLDPVYPAERLRAMLQDSAPVAVLMHGSGAALDTGSVPRLDLQAHASAWACQAQTDPSPQDLRPEHLAYVIYTSGSTGTPKGVALEHRNAVNFVSWARQAFRAQDLRHTLFATSISFDLAVYECFVPLASGGTVEIVANALALIEQPRDVSLINTVPSAMAALVKAGAVPANTRVVNLAGEALKRELVERIFETTQVETVCNLYGPTETTTYSTWTAMRRDQGFTAHIGRPLANNQVYVLDPQRQPVPIGVAGEIYIGGDGVARGYLNQPALTAERFLADPFSKAPQARMYKTGDLGRWLPEGTIEYLGRNDFQVKVRGFRIELGEIEQRLAQQPGVGEAVVLAREDIPGEKRLVAYVTTTQALDTLALRKQLGRELPEHMVPAAVVQLERLPLTPNGKLDRKALPAPDAGAYATREYEAPEGEVENTVAGIWAEVLKLERVGRYDNFFELGGDSLLAVKAVSMLRRAGMATSAGALFKCPTVAALAAEGQSAGAGDPAAAGALKVRGGSGTPLFLAHDGYGDELYCSALAQSLPAAWPIYGLPKVAGHERQLHTVAAMAARMVGLIRQVQPAGPYRIAGWSFGGVLAYEIARQLLAHGQAVEFLGLIDAFCPDASGTEEATLPTPGEVLISLCGEACPTAQAPFAQLFHCYRSRQALPENLEVLSPEEAEAQCRSLATHDRAMERYRPEPIGMPVHLFSALEGELEAREARGPSLGWRTCVPEGLLRVWQIPGSHVSIMKPPRIHFLGECVTRVLADLDASRRGGVATAACDALLAEQEAGV